MRLYKIADIGKIVSGSTPKTGVDSYWNGNIHWVTPKEISALDTPYLNNTERKITEEGYKSCSTYLLPKGSILFSSRAPIGLVAIANIEVCTNQGFKSIILNNGFYPLYIYYILRYNSDRLQSLGVGTTFLELSKSRFEQFEIPIPNYSDQIKIATLLSKAEALIRQRKESIDLMDEFLRSTFLKMFGKVKGVKNRLGECCVINPIKSEIKDLAKDTEVSFMPMASVSETGEIDLAQTRTLSDVWTGFTYFKDNDVVFAKITPSMENGKGAIMNSLENGIGFGTTEFHVLRPIAGKSTPEWIYHLTKQASFRKLAERNMTGTAGQRRVPSTFLENYIVTVPSIALQNQFASIVEKTEVLKAQFQNSLADLKNLYASLSQRAFKGALDLSAVTIDETLLKEEIVRQPVPLVPFEIQEAMGLASKITQQYEKISQLANLTNPLTKQLEQINRLAKLAAPLAKQFEQWNRLTEPFRKVSTLPNAFLQAQKDIARIQEAINSAKVTNTDEGFNWATLADRIKTRYKDLHFNFEMLINFMQKHKLSESVQYYASEELKVNPRLNDAEDLKTFIQSAVQNVELDETQQRQTNPFLQLTQSFYNAEEENFSLSLHKEDFNLIKNKEIRMRSGIYFRIASTEA